MPKQYEHLTVDQLSQEILLFCVRNPQFVRVVFQAIKFPTFEHITNIELRDLLLEWRMKSRHDEHANQKLRALLKTELPPRTSKYMEGMPYPGNPVGLCHRIVIAWLYAQLHPPPDSPPHPKLHPKRMFYEVSASIPAEATEHWKTNWMRTMERLLPPDAARPNDQWLCENIFKTETVFRIQPCLWQDFNIQMAMLVRDLQTHNRDGFIIIVSEEMNHTMGATIKRRQGYIAFRFFDPNAWQAELAIGLSPSKPESWAEKISPSKPESWSSKIFDLTRKAGVSLAPNIDCTLVCLCQGPPSPLPITDWQAVKQIPSEKRILCVSIFLRAIGRKKRDYLNYVCELVDGISPDYFGVSTSDGKTILITAAERGISSVVIRILDVVPCLSQDIGEKVLRPMSNGTTALYIAAQEGFDNVVLIILKAIHKLQQELAQLLLQPRSDGSTAFYIAAQQGRDGVVGIILNMVPQLPLEFAQLLLQPMPGGYTAFHIAASTGRDEVVGVILNMIPQLPLEFAQLLLQPMGGWDPLEFAIHYKCPEPIIARLQALKS